MPLGTERSVDRTRLDGFLLTAILGRGGSGVVYSAVRDGKEVALKVLRADLALSDAERQRFVDEAGRMRRVKHPGLIGVLDAGTLSDGRPYIVMPRLEGQNLAQRLEAGPLPLDVALEVFAVLVEAVTALHESRLIHRDIKPENIFLEGSPRRGEPRIPSRSTPRLRHRARDASDESLHHHGGEEKTRGTPAYMAPERFFGSAATVQSDVYELAVTLYAMLVARLPWDHVQSAASRLAPRRPSDVGVDLPDGLVAALFHRAMSTRPEMVTRFPSASLFAEAVFSHGHASAMVSRVTAIVPVESADDPRLSVVPVERSRPVESGGSRLRIARAVAAVMLGAGGAIWRSSEHRAAAAVVPVVAPESQVPAMTVAVPEPSSPIAVPSVPAMSAAMPSSSASSSAARAARASLPGVLHDDKLRPARSLADDDPMYQYRK